MKEYINESEQQPWLQLIGWLQQDASGCGMLAHSQRLDLLNRVLNKSPKNKPSINIVAGLATLEGPATKDCAKA